MSKVHRNLVLALVGILTLCTEAKAANITLYAYNVNGNLSGSSTIKVSWSYNQTGGSQTGSAQPTSWSSGQVIVTSSVDPANVLLTVTLYRVSDPTKNVTLHLNANVTQSVRVVIPGTPE